jgi:hypothetical protein
MASPAGAQDGVPKAPVRIDPVRGGVMLRDVVPVRRGATRMDGPPPWSPELLASVVPDPRVTALVSELASDDFATRERAPTRRAPSASRLSSSSVTPTASAR